MKRLKGLSLSDFADKFSHHLPGTVAIAATGHAI